MYVSVYAVMVEKNAANPSGGKYVFPILFALLKNKNRATYAKLFGMIKALMPQFAPSIINVDFEQAVIHSLREAFLGSTINGCLYHLMKNFKKQIGNAGLMSLYLDPATNFTLASSMLISPPLSVYECFRESLARTAIIGACHQFFFVKLRTVMRPAPFPIHMWSCCDRTRSGEDRTNNFAEAAHRRLQTIMDVDHPSMGSFLGKLKEVQKLHDHDYEQCIAGKPAPMKRRTYRDADSENNSEKQ